MKTIQTIALKGKRVWVRVDFNVPLDKARNITDDARIRGALPTLQYALDQGAKLIVASHLGRPKGRPAPEFSLSPAAQRLESCLNRKVLMAGDCIGPRAASLVDGMADGDVVLLENLRYHAGEEKNEPAFARALAELCDVYVNDAFAVCHRAHASVAAITRFAPVSAAGLLLQKELDYFKKAMNDPRRPLVAIVGGAKVSSKLAALKRMLEKVDRIIIGGAMANTFLKQTGIDVGKSLVEDEMIDEAGAVMEACARKGIGLHLPVDVAAGDRFDPEAEMRIVPVTEIPPGWMALDIGPETSRRYAEALADAGTVVWNGPMGAFEMTRFGRGTTALAECVAGLDALTIVGGGDTDAAVHQAGVTDRIGYISTGGGAFLALLEGKSLPAVQALEAADGGAAI
ncbi:phosphoglycerate kinase [Desulfococcus sp.]|uniref:phosphoglycerate kinase n=1 Tax=Desulfococcus sp. TaxID=2025834 RepID=UPI003593CC08